MTASDGSWVPPEVDTRTPNVGRMYDYYLGGKNNLACDREAAEAAINAVPAARRLARENRAFLGRAVRFMSDAGIRQFVDIGTGLPTEGHVHQVTGEICPDARVAYVDNEPVVLAHARALIPQNDRTVVLDGDMRKPREILGSGEVRGLMDFSKPVGVLLVAMLHFAADDDDPRRIVRELMAPLVPGSALAISHLTSDGPPPAALETALHVYTRASAPLTVRGRDEISGLFTGLEIAEPGVVYVPDWRPTYPGRRPGRSRWLLGGVGIKPAETRQAA